MMRRFVYLVSVVALAAGLLALPMFRSSAVSVAPVTVIVELRDDPAAVYAAKAKQQGAVVSDEQMLAYRNGLTAKQNSFLTELTSRGQIVQLQSVTISNVRVDLRYTLVYNGPR